jgi:hypothetical protein
MLQLVACIPGDSHYCTLWCHSAFAKAVMAVLHVAHSRLVGHGSMHLLGAMILIMSFVMFRA